MFIQGFDIFKATDVKRLYQHFFKTLYNNASHLIILEGLPDNINSEFVMSNLILTGRVAAFRHDGDLMMLNCNVGGQVDAYYRPTRVLIANPVIGSKDLERDKDAVVIHFTPMDYLIETPKSSPQFCPEGGLYSLIAMCSNLLADNIASINAAQINTRVHAVFTAENSSAAKSAENTLKDQYEGKPYSVITSELLGAVNVSPLSTAGASKDLIELLEVCQYFFALFWNALGIDCNYNMKRERLITSEVDKNLQSLKVSITTILETLNADLDIVNSLFGTDIHAIMNPEFELRSAEEEDNSNEEVQMDSEMVGTGDSDTKSPELGAEGNSEEGDTGTDDESKQEDNDSDENSDSDEKGDEKK